ncbi:DNA repair protein RecN [Vagococcus lutrae]|uniref:DNA repair protein RecN n=1 Tax=Vagococcus lutrae TaxID=81947 RepID=UPI00200E63BB|nr:DNA repair protein RecN [Vagococcus lutrae]UQF23031.1 DNA repair protein RecN [Vagococcus lutrae]UQF64888.1 DNA repair protein RecN [Vagococcus lutrae]
MLQELTIKDFAIISQLDLSFSEGMTVLTGETGAGKSIIIDAVGLLVGGRGSTDFIREGAKKAQLQGQFEVSSHVFERMTPYLQSLGIEATERTMILSRDISLSGKNVCRINGHLVNTQALKKVGQLLVDIHGQHEHQELMDSERHLSFLDQYGGESLALLKARYQELFESYQANVRLLRNYQQNEREHAQRMDMLQFQHDEIAEANLKIGEEKALKQERDFLANYQEIVQQLSKSYDIIQGNMNIGALEQIGEAMAAMEAIEHLDSAYQTIAEGVRDSYYQLEEVARDISQQLTHTEMDDNRLEEVEERLTTIIRLKKKYGDSIEKILEYFDEIASELAESQNVEGSLTSLQKTINEQHEQLEELAQQLTQARETLSVSLEKAIIEQLGDLYLEKTRFEVRREKKELSDDGWDMISFYISTNPGEPLKPLEKVASGGELSRIILGMKTIFSKTHGVTSIVFDEVDTGVSGRVAQAIAEKIHDIAVDSQVLCITHLPQVAAHADQQYYISKKVVDGRTLTDVTILNNDEREIEIARMLAGETITDLSREHARELLKQAHK